MGVYSSNHTEYSIALLACLRLGNTITTANPTYTPEELNFQLNDSGATMLITLPELLPSARKAIIGTKVEQKNKNKKQNKQTNKTNKQTNK